MSQYVDDFVNNTQTFQINDARQLPFIVPSMQELECFEGIFNKALEIKQSTNDESDLAQLQSVLDEKTMQLYSLS